MVRLSIAIWSFRVNIRVSAIVRKYPKSRNIWHTRCGDIGPKPHLCIQEHERMLVSSPLGGQRSPERAINWDINRTKLRVL